jgi:hypothetical protein
MLIQPRLAAVVIVLAPALVLAATCAVAQDETPSGGEPIDPSVTVTQLSYDYLVDGDLPQDAPDERKFKTLQAAYAAAPAGTAQHPTVIGIRPNVYFLHGTSARGPSLSVRKDYLTFLGLTNDRRTVVLADNRGLMQGADDDGYIIDVNATGFTARNLTILNACNTDYAYPGNPAKSLKKRSDVITQAVALQAAGDKHVYENVALLSRLDTMFLRTTRSYFHRVYIEGTDDWMGGGQISYWEDCTLVYPTGRGVMSASNVVFHRCRFEATKGMQFYKAEFHGAERPDALIDCVVPDDEPGAPVAWVRGIAPPRPSVYSLTYRLTDASGRPARIRDATRGPATYNYARELSDSELSAFTPRNLLRAPPSGPADHWNPAGSPRGTGGRATGAPQVFRIALSGTPASIRTGAAPATLRARVYPSQIPATSLTWSTSSPLVQLDRTAGSEIIVSGRNTTDAAQWVAIDAAAPNGFRATAHVYVEPRYTAPPAFLSGPTLRLPSAGAIDLDYALDLKGRPDRSLVTWYLCDDPAGAHARKIAVSRGNEPLRHLPLTTGMIGKFIEAIVAPKHELSDPGPEAAAFTRLPVSAVEVCTSAISPDFRSFAADPEPTYENGLWTVVGTWAAVSGEDYEHGYGIHAVTPGVLLLQQDGAYGDMQVDLVMIPEKTEGTGFSVPGSPADTGLRNLHADIYIKYDARTQTGYALRFWRTTESAAKCRFQWYRIDHGAGTPVDSQSVLTGVFKPTTHLTLRARGNRLAATASNTADGATLALTSEMIPNRFGGAGVSWPRGSTNVYSRIEVTYP